MKNEFISDYLQSRIDAKDFPSAVYLVAEKGEVIFTDALGFAVVEPEKIAANLDTIYDLASLTKVLVTGLLCAKLIERGELKLDDKITRFLPRFGRGNEDEINIQNLLSHSSGLPAWKPFYLLPDAHLRSIHLSIIDEESVENETVRQITYSDLNFFLLSCILEDLYSKTRLDDIAKIEIFAPLRLKATFFNPSTSMRSRIAANEKGNEYEKQMCIEQGYEIRNHQSAFRTQTIWGEVHDGNAYFMNGVSGHAGLFSTAFETFKIAQQFLANQTTLLKPETCELFRTNFTPNLNEARSIGFQLAATKDSTASEALSKDSFGHLGFTGTSLWIEPESERIFILLTNRTHAHELPFANINAVRRRFHELAAAMLNER